MRDFQGAQGYRSPAASDEPRHDQGARPPRAGGGGGRRAARRRRQAPARPPSSGCSSALAGRPSPRCSSASSTSDGRCGAAPTASSARPPRTGCSSSRVPTAFRRPGSSTRHRPRHGPHGAAAAAGEHLERRSAVPRRLDGQRLRPLRRARCSCRRPAAGVLIKAGISFAGGADGVFGSATAGAIMSFQRARGLTVSGKVDEATAAALGLSAASEPAPSPGVSVCPRSEAGAGPVQLPGHLAAPPAAMAGSTSAPTSSPPKATQVYAVATGKITKIYSRRPRLPVGQRHAGRPRRRHVLLLRPHVALRSGHRVGTGVSAGQLIGYVGQDGQRRDAHLHSRCTPAAVRRSTPTPSSGHSEPADRTTTVVGADRRRPPPIRGPDRANGRIPRLILDIQLNQGELDWPALARSRPGGGDRRVRRRLGLRPPRRRDCFGGDQMFEAFALLGALAASTTTIELGTMVANVNNRTPAVLALAAATVRGHRRPPLPPRHRGRRCPRQLVGDRDARRRTARRADPPGRHRLVEEALDIIDLLWDADRPPEMATFPLPHPRPPVIVGVNGDRLAAIAGRRADGVNVDWAHPRRDELFEIASTAAPAAGRPAVTRTTWLRWDPALLDPAHPTRVAMVDQDVARAVLVVPADVTASELGRLSAGSR